ncbi:hypothetical protein IKP85_01360 [bacterium]|nr:hypothetical protein [bacterium]
MTRIKRLNCFDIPKIRKMTEYLGNDDSDRFAKDLQNEAIRILHSHFPLKYKFLPESYVLLEKDEILGLITILPTMGNPYKIMITRLIFQNNLYDVGKQLVEFVIAKYGAQGAVSFSVTIDNSHDELFRLFLDGCGFRHCSCENLWKIENFNAKDYNPANFRVCQNYDSGAVSELYNSELNNLYKPALLRTKNEFKEPFFAGITNFYKNRYVLEEAAHKKIIAYLSITTADNTNFILDLSINDGYDISYDEVLAFVYKEIGSRKSNFYIFFKQKKYTNTSEKFEEYLHSRNFNCIQTQNVLVKDFYRPIKQSENVLKVFLFGENGIAIN